MIVLPFPSSILAGHAEQGRWEKARAVKAHRAAAKEATEAVAPSVPAEGDIRIHMRFVPANRRGDRVNFPNRMKPYIDGIADALGVNDSRFLPSYEFAEPEKPGRVEVELLTYLCTDPGTALGGIDESCLVNGDRPNSEAIK